MEHRIKTLYVVHHSHTDIGYTDLQERVIDAQVHYIRNAVRLTQLPENRNFRWNCETYFCVEEFLKEAAPDEREAFFELLRTGRMGFSAMYLNFNDLADCAVLRRRLAQVAALMRENGVEPVTAMCADINGISMGQRDALLDNGVEFLMTNIHCHHGMYPLYQNQNAYFWENAAGKRLLVWNGEHYNLGNVLGLKPNRSANFMTENHGGATTAQLSPVEALRRNLDEYLTLCEDNGYPYDFITSAVSGVFSDNAPPEPEILRTIEGYNALYGGEVFIRMVSLRELYDLIRGKLQGSPVLRGDLNDWWANGVGSTPYAVKHYRDAQRIYHLCERLDAGCREAYPDYARRAEDHLLLYAEHTWGHSCTVTCPYEDMVLHLDMRKNGYASAAHESASRMLNRVLVKKGDMLNYYNTSGRIKACNPNDLAGLRPVEFYIESPVMENVRILCADGTERAAQVSPHPRGRRITFVDDFAPREEKEYRYEELPARPSTLNSRKAYVGSERVRDIVNDYDPISYLLPYEAQNEFFRLTYAPGEGVTGLWNRRSGESLLPEGGIPLFTPIYEHTAVRLDAGPCPGEAERRLLGRNIRGKHATYCLGELREVVCREQGPVFTLLELVYALEGSIHCSVFVKLYNDVPRIDWKLQLGKTISGDIESVFMPLSLRMEGAELYFRKGAEAYRPGVDQLPGTCMEYSMNDDGAAYVCKDTSALIAARDTPLFYMGELRHHPIRLCEGKSEDNARPLYSWVMNNTWETNFKMDLSGFGEFRYSLWLDGGHDGESAMDVLRELCFDPCVVIVE